MDVCRTSGAARIEGGEVADLGERLRLLVEAVKEYAIYLLDRDGTVVTWNPGVARLVGYSAEQIVGRHCSLFYAPEDVRSGKPEDDLRTAADEGSLSDEGWRVRKDGTRFWANAVITALRSGDGALRGFAQVIRDDTEARAARERATAFQHITGALLGGAAADEVLSLIAHHARELAGAARTWITVPGPHEGTLLAAAAEGLDLGPRRGELFQAAGTVAESVIRSRAPQLVSDFPAASSAGTALTGLGAALAVPMLAGEQILGVLTAAAPAAGPGFRPIDLEVLRVFAAQAAVVLEYERAQQALRTQLVAEDRERIARGLQHNVIQRLFAAGLTIESVAQRVGDDQIRAALLRTIDQFDDSIRQLRSAVFELHGPNTPAP
jgi:PAS domain S-box-containing protein